MKKGSHLNPLHNHWMGKEKETDVLQIKGLASDLPLTPNSKALSLHQSPEGLIQGADLAHPCLLRELDPDKATS